MMLSGRIKAKSEILRCVNVWLFAHTPISLTPIRHDIMTITGIKTSLTAGSAALLLAFGAVTASAQTNQSQGHFYIGSDLGFTNMEDLEADNEITAGIFGGYQFNRNFRLEVGIRHLASDDYSYGDRYDWYDEDFSLSAFQVSGVFLAPLNQNVNLYGRLGMARVEAETKYTDNYGGRHGYRFVETISTSENLGFGGIGVEVNVWNSLNVFAEYVQYQDFKDVGLSTVSAGVTWHF